MSRAYKKKFHLLYKTTCHISNKFYVGMHSTDDPFDGYLGSGKILWRSIKKHGKENHSVEFLDLFDNRKDLVEAEKAIVNKGLLSDPFCMNIRPGGQCFAVIPESWWKGKKHSEESKRKMSECRMGMKFSDNHRKNISKAQRGRKLTEKWKANIGKSGKGKIAHNKRAIFVDGVEYESIALASALTGLKKSTIGKRILSKNFFDTYYKDSPKIIG